MSLLVPDVPSGVCLAVFLLCTPVAMVAVFVLGQDALWWAVANAYAMSAGMLGLFVCPLLLRGTGSQRRTLHQALDVAVMNWVIWVSVFTQVAFQIPHNQAVALLHANRGTVGEWPFFAYALADSRWAEYNNGTGLDPEVWLINTNDALSGVIVLAALLYWQATKSRLGPLRSKLPFVLATLFRDADLFRETVEYMYDHHRSGYALTTQLPGLRCHGVAILWAVNILWLLVPPFTLVWAHATILDLAQPTTSSGGGAKGEGKKRR